MAERVSADLAFKPLNYKGEFSEKIKIPPRIPHSGNIFSVPE
jgi:hypothetical protein